MINKLIAVVGEPDTGKTTSIKNACGEFSNRQGVELVYSPPRFRFEVFRIYEINGIKVGFSSMGDVRRIMRERLEILNEKGCKIIIAACRKTGVTREEITNFATKHDFVIDCIKTTKQNSDSAIAASNSEVKSQILNHIDNYLN